MQTFRDNAGRTWAVSVDVAAIKRVRALAGFDLLSIMDGKAVDRLIADPVLLCDVLCAVCRPEAERLGVTDEDFGRAMAGDAIDHATQALLEELVSFCPNPRDRKRLRKFVTTMWTTMEKARDILERKLDERLEDASRQALTALGGSSGSSPVS
jgi:hypothetical protein